MFQSSLWKRCGVAVLLAVACGVAGAAPVDINTADAATLARELKGVGEAKAAAIVEYRRTHGAFKSLEELAMVKGIGQKLVERNRADLRIGHSTSPPAAATGKPAGTPSAGAAGTRK